MPHKKEISDSTIEVLKGSVLDAVVAVDADGVVVAWNAVAASLFGWTAEEAVGQSLGTLIVPPAHQEAHRRGMARYEATGIARVLGQRIDITAVNRAGHEFPVELSIVPAPVGGSAAFIGFLRDISERHFAQARLVLSEESLRLTMEAGEIGTWDLDLLTDRLTWSDRTKAIFGVSIDVTCTMADFDAGLHPDDRATIQAAFLSSLDPEARATYDVEFRIVRRDDQRIRWVAAKGRGIFDGAGRCVRALGTVIDITARKREEARRDVMLDLTDLLRGGDVTPALQAACALMGSHFDVSRVGFARLQPKENVFRHTLCWTDGSVPPLLGDYPAQAMGEHIMTRLTQGETIVVQDLFANAVGREPQTLTTGPETDARAMVVVPLLRDGRLHTIVYLHASCPRAWTPDDVEFMLAIAERTRQRLDRAEAEAALSARETEFRTLAQALPNHVWSAEPDGMVTWFNAQVYAYSGAEEGELDGLGWAQLVHPDDVEGAASAWLKAVMVGETYETEFRIRRKDGAYRWHLIRAVPLRGPGGQITRWIGTNTDVEAQRLELEDSKDFARLALGAVGGIGVWTYDVADDRFIFDEAIARVYGLPQASVSTGLKREAFLANVHPDDMSSLRATMSSGLTTAGELELEYRIVHPDGSIHWVLSRGRTYFEKGRPVRRTGVGVETTGKRLLEDQLRQAQKMEAVGQLTGGIAHDFNNMLAVVMGSLDLLNRRIGGEDARARHFVQSASDAAKRAANLTHRLLAFSRQQPLQPETIDPNRLVSGMSDLLRHSIGADIRLETVLSGGVWRTHVDPNQLENVILNLSVNARDAMPDGGRLTIETQNAHLDSRYALTEVGVAPGQYVMIAVSDTGAGMPEDVIAKAFDPFFTTKEVGKGTGLGLSQVYGFVKQTGGHVKIYSEVGQGTTIKIYLPGSDETGLLIQEVDAIPAHLAGERGEMILVVDDEPAVRQFSADALMELGYEVLQADSAEAGLRLLVEHSEIALLFTDIVMPDTNGRKFADVAIKLRPNLKVLFTTGYTRNAVVHNGIVDKGVELIGKPFTIDELAARVRLLLDTPKAQS